jgi:hypothetical protein
MEIAVLTQLNFESLGEVDHGSLRVAVDQALTQAYRDMADRPSLKKARKVELIIEYKPESDERGELTYIDVNFSIKASMPPKSLSAPMKAGRSGPEFQPAAPDNPDQSTIDFE